MRLARGGAEEARWYPATTDVNRFFRSALFPLIIIVVLVYLASQTLLPGGSEQQKLTYSQLITRGGERERQRGPLHPVAPADHGDPRRRTRARSRSTTRRRSRRRSSRTSSTKQSIEFDSKGTGSSAWWAILINFLPILLLIGFWIFLMNQMQGGGSKVMSFGKSRAKRMSPDSPKVTFKDVAGADEAVEELHEIKEFLENPKKFQALGARIPKGVLLYGPPGTGKTLLARAVAGEAGVPFFSISGSDFVEMFVGVGASRVRDLFEQAKQASPCIIFMDEIDAVGRHRGAGLGGGHDEREQTLNQLLVEMDGFEMKDNIILIAATNRPDILDPALLRPGRFDRQIVVDRPDRTGARRSSRCTRAASRSRATSSSTRSRPARPGFTGADLSNLINEAALLAARNGKKMIEQNELEEGIMRVIAGPEKKARLLSEKERKITAYHEMGHALVGHYLEHTNPVHKITIVSRGQALGLTISLPTEDKYLTTKSTLMDDLAMTLGGRAAEELVFHEVTTGAANDLERVTCDLEADDHALRDEREARPARPRPRARHAVPRARHGLGARLLGRDREGDRRRDPARDRGGARVRDGRPARAHGRAAPPLGDPHRARDDRQGSVRAPARRRVGGVRLPGGSRRAGDRGARGREEAEAAAAAAPDPGRRDAAAARSRGRASGLLERRGPRAATRTVAEHRRGRDRAEQVEREPTRPHGVDEREQDRGDDEGADGEQRDDGRVPQTVARVARASACVPRATSRRAPC